MMRKFPRTFCLAQILKLSANGSVSLCRRGEKRMANDTHLKRFTVYCLLIRQRCKKTSCLTCYWTSPICIFWICGRHLAQFVYHSSKTVLVLFTSMRSFFLQQTRLLRGRVVHWVWRIHRLLHAPPLLLYAFTFAY